MSKALEMQQITKRFGTKTILEQLDLTVENGEIVALLGASGSGKTTLLRLIAGLFPPDAGQLLIGGRLANLLPPEARGLGYVFQDYALMPHLNALQNLTLVMQKQKNPERTAKELLNTVGLSGFESTRPERLSGGQRQRVAIARALAVNPALILLDEPYSALDPILRESLRADVARLIRQAGRSALHVTHDPDEAFAVADRLIVLGQGKILQTGTPEQVYRHPSSLGAARALGRLNELELDVMRGFANVDSTSFRVDAADGKWTLAWRWEDAKIAQVGIPAILEQITPTRGFYSGIWRVGTTRIVAPCHHQKIGDQAFLEVLHPMVF